MPTPHGSRGGMAFSADELRVLRRALAHVLNPPIGADARPDGSARAAWVEDVQDVLRLSEAIDEAVHEGGRMRAFALAELVRYRAALPGSASGYLERLEEAVADGYLPDSDDLTALRAVSALPCAQAERARRTLLRQRCAELAEASVRRRLDGSPVFALAAPRAAPELPVAAGQVAERQVIARQSEQSKSQPQGQPQPVSASEAPVGQALEIPRPPRIASVSIGGKVADFARANRPTRLRDKTRAESYPLPARRGGTIAMSKSTEHTAPASQPHGQPQAPAQNPKAPASARPVRPIPTPGDLFPRGVRPAGDQDEELATGTG
ncbi:hypothetical protein ABIA32_004876 [Streptacidiphilus sp. MAP12-20]|uniref:hypothetical protein n=1 Tax=Streptacidiphilus sp. MAP12-20 TaxID=3156299 RepID=UPI003516B4FD